jgi:CRP-like cAMP-binding protein
MVQVKAGHVFFSQGANADWVYFLDSGRAKLTVVSKRGKEATVTLLIPGDFIGEESLAGCYVLQGPKANPQGDDPAAPRTA